MDGGYLTTHVLDTSLGLPAGGLSIALFRFSGPGIGTVGTQERELLAEMITNADGRTDSPILPADQFRPGVYELVFAAGAYLRQSGAPAQKEPLFLDDIPIRFGMNEPVHYHVPLLLSPFGYSTYRGS